MEKLNLENIFEESFKLNASDIHLTEGEKIVFRINGELLIQEKFCIPKKDELQNLIFPFLLLEEIEKLNLEKELDFSFEKKDLGRYRGNLSFSMGRICIVLRVISKDIPKLETLGFGTRINLFTKFTKGLILITGGTGQGKSTTLASLIDKINGEKSLNIITLEDPIEYIFKNKQSLIKQREVGKDIKSFKDSLKSILRQDPDVIAVTELRDRETIELALLASETGHLVISTIHTNGAVETIERIAGEFPQDKREGIYNLLAFNLKGIISQEFYKDITGEKKLMYEILIVNNAVKNMIKSKNIIQIYSLMENGTKEGMITKEKSLNI
ncbi:MAG: type IV pilus twitching motility protein PilT [Cetobacterium sp.]